MEKLIEWSCKWAMGKETELAIANAIYDERVTAHKNDDESEPLLYYDASGFFGCDEVGGFITVGGGGCAEWAKFFAGLCASQGINGRVFQIKLDADDAPLNLYGAGHIWDKPWLSAALGVNNSVYQANHGGMKFQNTNIFLAPQIQGYVTDTCGSFFDPCDNECEDLGYVFETPANIGTTNTSSVATTPSEMRTNHILHTEGHWRFAQHYLVILTPDDSGGSPLGFYLYDPSFVEGAGGVKVLHLSNLSDYPGGAIGVTEAKEAVAGEPFMAQYWQSRSASLGTNCGTGRPVINHLHGFVWNGSQFRSLGVSSEQLTTNGNSQPLGFDWTLQIQDYSTP